MIQSDAKPRHSKSSDRATHPRLDDVRVIIDPNVDDEPDVSSMETPQTNDAIRQILDGDPFSAFKFVNHFDRLQSIARDELTYPVTVEIDPSNVCNHRCQWCVSFLAHNGDMLKFDRFDKLVEELETMHVESVVLKGGGEPTVHPQFVDMLHRLKDRGLGVGLISNGSMPRKGTPDAVLECVDWVRISLDAATAETHNAIHQTKDFDRIIDNIGYLARNTKRTLVGVNFVCEERNHLEIVPFAELCKSLGVGYVSIRCVFDPDNPFTEQVRAGMRQGGLEAKKLETEYFRVKLGNFTNEYLDAQADQPFPYERCLGPNMVGVVGGDGEMYACCFLRGNREFSFGNVNEQSFKEVWESEHRREVMERVYAGECGYACKGGMTFNRYNIYNQLLNYMALEEKQHANFA